jgi:pentatricopeptide repeat protein
MSESSGDPSQPGVNHHSSPSRTKASLASALLGHWTPDHNQSRNAKNEIFASHRTHHLSYIDQSILSTTLEDKTISNRCLHTPYRLRRSVFGNNCFDQTRINIGSTNDCPRTMNLPCITCHVMFFWMLLSHEAHSFTPFSVSNHPKSQLCWRDNNIQRPYAFTLPVTASTKADDESLKDSTIDAESEKEIVLNFVDMVQSTPAGELQVDEIDLLREIMSDFSGDSQPAWVVESLLRRLLKEWEAALQNGDSEKEEAFRPTAQDFSVAISAWEKSHNPDKVIHVLSILSDQRELFLNDLPTVQPDLPTIKRVMGILADSREKGVDKRASQVFESLADFGLTADPDIFGLMVTILAKSRTRGAAKRAETLLREAVELYPPQMVNGEVTGIGVDVFNVVVTAYAKGGEESGPEQAQQFIVFMDQLDSENGSLGICSPNINTFTSLIDAYAQTNEWDEVSQADRTLNRLLDQYMEGNDDLEPNVATWTIVISAWARLSKKNRKGAADRAGRLLKRMEALSQEGRISFKPDAITYVTCMNAYAFSKDDNCAAEAEKILDEMNEMYLDGDDSMKPSARSVKVVTDSWIKAGDMESAEDFLDRYEDILLSDDSVKMAQELNDLYRSLLFGYTQQDNIERARFYLDYMVEEGMQPDSFCFDRYVYPRNENGRL